MVLDMWKESMDMNFRATTKLRQTIQKGVQKEDLRISFIAI